MKVFLLLNLAIGFYNIGTIWAHEVDIFRSWRYAGASFHQIQEVHWRKLPYWVLAPVALAYAGAIALIWFHPPGSPIWAIVAVFGCQTVSLVLTALFWGKWQAALSRDPAGAESLYLSRILRTHWLRTALITVSGLALLAWSVIVLAT